MNTALFYKMYAKLNNGVIEKYPYTLNDLRKDNLQTSFPSEIPNSVLEEFQVFAVKPTDKPVVALDKTVVEGTPEFVDGYWKQVWVVSDAPYEKHLEQVLKARASEYPPTVDYLDGVVKGDQEQIQKYINNCLAVKTKYPKPEKINV